MTEGPYRGHQQARRRPEIDERIAACQRRLGPDALAVLPAAHRARIGRLRALTEGDDDPSVDAAREELAALLVEAVDLVEERDGDARRLPTEPPSAPELLDRWGPLGSDGAAAEPLLVMTAMAMDVDPQAEVLLAGARLTARFRSGTAPIVWSVQLRGHLGSSSGEALRFTSASHWLATSIPHDFPALAIRREGLGDAVGKALRLKSEVQLGDPAFDDELFVEGDTDFARAILQPTLRAAFVRRARQNDFTFRSSSGTASLVWDAGLVTGVIGPDVRPAVDVLVAVREAFASLRLLQQP